MPKSRSDQLDVLFEHTAPQLVLYARQWLGPEAAEEIVQDVFVKLIMQRRPPDDPRAWLFRCVRNAAISRLRSRVRRRRRDEAASRESTRLDDRPDGGLDSSVVEAALTALAPDDREIVVLRVWGDLTWQQVADVVGRPLATVYGSYRRALNIVRTELEKSSCHASPNSLPQTTKSNAPSAPSSRGR